MNHSNTGPSPQHEKVLVDRYRIATGGPSVVIEVALWKHVEGHLNGQESAAYTTTITRLSRDRDGNWKEDNSYWSDEIGTLRTIFFLAKRWLEERTKGPLPVHVCRFISDSKTIIEAAVWEYSRCEFTNRVTCTKTVTRRTLATDGAWQEDNAYQDHDLPILEQAIEHLSGWSPNR